MIKKKSDKKMKMVLVLIFLFSIINCQNQINKANDLKLSENEANNNQQLFQQSSTIQQEQTNKAFDNNSQTKSGYKRIYNSSEFYRQFSSKLSKITFSQTVNVTHLSNGKQICIDSLPCQFFYYVIKPRFDPQTVNSFAMNGNNYVRNVLFVSGMHGNQYLGPLSLLHAISKLETPSTRIIIFPLANPSGFDHNSRLTFPSKLDPNRDFPIEQYTKCYQTTSSLIIDHIFRKYHIDLTLALHNGNSQIAWNWGTQNQHYNSRTFDEVIYRDIGEWLKFTGGKNKDISMVEFSIGTMNEVVYPVKGGFQDWAYAASWYNASQGKKPTRGCAFSPFPFNMTNGLVFLFELGPFDVDEKLFGSQSGIYMNPVTKQLDNGYISRAIRMFIGMIKIANPRIQLRFTNQQMVMNLLGCKNGIVNRLKISNKQNSSVYYYESKQKLVISGNINNKTIQPTIIKLQEQFYTAEQIQRVRFNKLQPQDLVVEYNLVCDSHWNGRGKTIFGQKRQFNVRESLLLTPISTLYSDQSLFPTLQQALSNSHNNNHQSQNEQSYISQLIQDNSETLMIIIILILIISSVICVIWIVCKDIRKDMKQRRIERLKKKLQKINQQSSIQQISPYQSAQINLPQIKMIKRQQQQHKRQQQAKRQSLRNNKKHLKKPVETYPQMCESDKSMKTQQLEYIYLLSQFIQRQQQQQYLIKHKNKNKKIIKFKYYLTKRRQIIVL